MVHWLGRTAHQYASGNAQEYYASNTAIDAETLRRALRLLCLDCVWGAERVQSAVARRRSCAGRKAPLAAYWGAKAFPDKDSAQGLAWLFPDCRFIYIFRNGVDVVHSMGSFPAFQKLSFAERCHFWAVRAMRYEYLRHSDRAVTIQFETFVENPSRELKRALRHLAVPEEPDPAEFASSHLIHPLGKPTVRESPHAALSRRAPAWAEWREQERATFRSICEEGMLLLGYSLPF